MGHHPVQPLLTAGLPAHKLCPMRYAAPHHHIPTRAVHAEGVPGVEGLLQQGQYESAAFRVRQEGGAREADGVVGAARMGVARSLGAVLEVVRDLDAVIVLESG